MWTSFKLSINKEEIGILLAFKNIKWKLIAERTTCWGGFKGGLVSSLK